MIAFRDDAEGSANSSTATVTVPTTCCVGDVLIVHLSLNNTDNLVTSPSALVLLTTNTTSAAFPNRLYYGVVDGINISPGDTLTWTLSSIRSWTLNLYAASGVNNLSPLRNFWVFGTVATTTSGTITNGFPAGDSWLVEVGSGKSSGTAISTWTAPSGWTVRANAPAGATGFQGSSFIADYDAGIVPAGTYGGDDTYTADNQFDVFVGYMVALNPEPLYPSGMLLANTAEGGTDGTTITSGNSGGNSGTSWETVSIGSGAAATFSSTQAIHGGLSYHLTTGATGVNAYLTWGNARITSQSMTLYSRMYCYFPTAPPTVDRFFEFTNTSIQLQGGIGTTGTNNFRLRDASNNIVGTSSTAIPIGQWFRLEFMVFSDASNGILQARIFLSPDSTSPDETVTVTGLNTRGDLPRCAGFGDMSSTANFDMYLDDVAVTDQYFLGPADPTADLGWLQPYTGGQLAFYEDFENGTAGSAVNTTNTDFDKQFGTGVATFDNTMAASGTMCMRVDTSGTYNEIGTSVVGGASGYYARFALYISGFPSTTLYMGIVSNAGVAAAIRIASTGKLSITNNSNPVDTSTNTVPVGQWFLVEWNVDIPSSTQTCRLYSGLTGTPLETLSGTYDQGNFVTFYVGTVANNTMTMWVDSVAVSLEDWVGPLS